MIRPTVPGETAALLDLATETGLFSPLDLEALQEVLDDYHAEAHTWGHRCVTYEQDGQIVGFAYYAPAAMTDNTWYLWWIAVRRQLQARGLGSRLLHHVEHDVRNQGGRLLLIETSSLPSYELTRRFYRKQGYAEHAVLRDYYADGHHMVVFRKRLQGVDEEAPAGAAAAPST